MKVFMVLIPMMSWLTVSCLSDSYVQYLVDPEVVIDPQLLRQPTDSQATVVTSQHPPIKVRYGDGEGYSEVEIPVVSRGQRVVIEHRRPDEPKVAGPDVMVRPPYPNDSSHKVLAGSYVQKGLRENQDAAPISLSDAQSKIKQFYQQANYDMALRVADKALARYPSHPTFLRAKGSILTAMGERDLAIEIYENAQDVEYDETVDWQLATLRGEP